MKTKEPSIKWAHIANFLKACLCNTSDPGRGQIWKSSLAKKYSQKNRVSAQSTWHQTKRKNKHGN